MCIKIQTGSCRRKEKTKFVKEYKHSNIFEQEFKVPTYEERSNYTSSIAGSPGFGLFK